MSQQRIEITPSRITVEGNFEAFEAEHLLTMAIAAKVASNTGSKSAIRRRYGALWPVGVVVALMGLIVVGQVAQVARLETVNEINTAWSKHHD